jgi:N-acetylmuramoyl-L-alanine amidase
LPTLTKCSFLLLGKRAVAAALGATILVTPCPSVIAASAACGDPSLVTLDIGHTPSRPGAISARRQTEYSFNQRLASELAAALRARKDIEVQIFNEAGNEISVADRASRLGAIDRGVIVSLHHDSVQKVYLQQGLVDGKAMRFSRHAKGYALFVSGRSAAFEASKSLALAIGSQLQMAGFPHSTHHAELIRGEGRPVLDAKLGLFRFDELAVVKDAQVPAVLVEAGVIVNPEEELELENPAVRGRIVKALAKGITAFCGLQD